MKSAVMGGQLKAALAALKVSKHPRYGRDIMRCALLRFEEAECRIVVYDDEMKPHATSVVALPGKPFSVCVDYKTLKQWIALCEPFRLEIELVTEEKPGGLTQDRLLVKDGRARALLNAQPLADFPFEGEISQTRPELVWAEYKWKLPKEKPPVKRKPLDYPEYPQPRGTNGVWAWLERDQQRRLKIRQQEDALQLPKDIRSEINRAWLRKQAHPERHLFKLELKAREFIVWEDDRHRTRFYQSFTGKVRRSDEALRDLEWRSASYFKEYELAFEKETFESVIIEWEKENVSESAAQPR